MLLLLALSAFVFIASNNANAQFARFPCPFGPGPGERVIGQEAGTQMCTYAYVEPSRGEQQPQYPVLQGPPPKPKVFTDSYYAVVVHPDATKVWASYRYRKLADAKQLSLANCTKTMGKGCTIAVTGVNQVVTIYNVNDGSLKWTVSPRGEEKEQAIKACYAEGKRCIVADQIISIPVVSDEGDPIPDMKWTLNPENTAALRNLYGAIAWTGTGNKIWATGGHKTRADAESTALAMCKTSSPAAAQACISAMAIGNGTMIVWMDKKKNIQFDSDVALPADITPRLTWDHFDRICKSKKPKCTLKHLVQARQAGQKELLVM
jgi:hypothetical protein